MDRAQQNNVLFGIQVSTIAYNVKNIFNNKKRITYTQPKLRYIVNWQLVKKVANI